MRTALPIYSGRISPVFDVARRLLVVDADVGTPPVRQEVVFEKEDLSARSSHLLSLGVDVLICGAISRPLEIMLAGAGVNVIPNTCGPVEEVLDAFLSGQLTERSFLMPGCGGGRRCRGRHGNGRMQMRKAVERRFEMPKGDGTGPQGKGSRSGRGLGPCAPGQEPQPNQGVVPGMGSQFGLGQGRGQGRGQGGRGQGGGGGNR